MVVQGSGQFRNGDDRHPLRSGRPALRPGARGAPVRGVHRRSRRLGVLLRPRGRRGDAVSGLERTLHRDYYLVRRASSRWSRSGSSAASGSASAGRRSSPHRATTLVRDVAGESILAGAHPRGRTRRRTTTSAATAARSWCPTAERASFAGGIRCPYHSWTYTLDGALRTAPVPRGERRSRQGRPRRSIPVGVDTWGGFVFVNLVAEEAAGGHSLAGQLAGVPERLRRYPAGRAPGRAADRVRGRRRTGR